MFPAFLCLGCPHPLFLALPQGEFKGGQNHEGKYG